MQHYGPPENAKPAPSANGTGSIIASVNQTQNAYQITAPPSTINERQAWHVVRFFNSAPRLTREARRVGVAMVILARAVRSSEVYEDQIASEAGLNIGRAVAALYGLGRAGLIRRTAGGFSLNWEALS